MYKHYKFLQTLELLLASINMYSLDRGMDCILPALELFKQAELMLALKPLPLSSCLTHFSPQVFT